MFGLLFDVLPKVGLLISGPGTLASLIGGVLLIIAGQWALGILLLILAAGLGFVSFKLWQSLQPVD